VEDDQSKYDALFKKLGDKVSDIIASAISKDEKLLILSTDLDSMVCAMIIYYLMKSQKMNYTNAMSLVRERRISLKLHKM